MNSAYTFKLDSGVHNVQVQRRTFQRDNCPHNDSHVLTWTLLSIQCASPVVRDPTVIPKTVPWVWQISIGQNREDFACKCCYLEKKCTFPQSAARFSQATSWGVSSTDTARIVSTISPGPSMGACYRPEAVSELITGGDRRPGPSRFPALKVPV